jgi:uncharacterized protein (DUF305 family)
MSTKMWAILGAVLVVGLGAGVGIGAAVWGGGDHGSSASGGHGGGSLGEREYINMMIPHHLSAVAQAKVALERSTRPEVRRLANEIVSSQEAEIAEMTTIYRERFGEDPAPDTSGPHGTVDTTEIETVEQPRVDRVFLEDMIPHHASAITMSEDLLAGDPGPGTSRLADAIISAQAIEIGQMQAWLDRWYPEAG